MALMILVTWAARLPVSAGQAAQDAQRRGQARYRIEAFISVRSRVPFQPPGPRNDSDRVRGRAVRADFPDIGTASEDRS
jgi:hypothetical protein